MKNNKEKNLFISALSIENFQSHAFSRLDFSRGLNIITGPSDHGKSAILRAVKWVLYNEPRGLDFIREGASTAKVTLWLSNGYTITRERSKKKNVYTVSDPQGVEESYEGFGNEVPQEVVKAHGIAKVVLDTDLRTGLNIGEQLEQAFLISETGAVRAKAVGRLAGLHIFDKAIRECLADIKREEQSASSKNNSISVITKKLEDFQFLGELGKRIESLEVLMQSLDYSIKRKEKVENYNKVLKSLSDEYKGMTYIKNKLSNIDRSSDILKTCEVFISTLNSFKQLMRRLNEAEKLMGININILKNTVRIADANSLLDKIPVIKMRLEKASAYELALSKITRVLMEQNDIVQNARDSAAMLLKEYVSLLKRIRICPLCGCRLNEEKIKDIMNDYKEEY